MKNYVCLQTNSTKKKKGEMYTCYKDRNEKRWVILERKKKIWELQCTTGGNPKPWGGPSRRYISRKSR